MKIGGGGLGLQQASTEVTVWRSPAEAVYSLAVRQQSFYEERRKGCTNPNPPESDHVRFRNNRPT